MFCAPDKLNFTDISWIYKTWNLYLRMCYVVLSIHFDISTTLLTDFGSN